MYNYLYRFPQQNCSTSHNKFFPIMKAPKPARN